MEILTVIGAVAVVAIIALIVWGQLGSKNQKKAGDALLAEHPDAARVRDEVDSGVPNVLSIQLDRVDGTPPPIVKDESGSWKLLVPNVAHTCLLTIVKPGQRPVYLKNVNDFQLTLAPNQRVTLFADVSRGLDNAEIIVSPV